MVTSLFELFQRGGPVMWPILLTSITALAIVIERFIVLSRLDTDSHAFLTEVEKQLQERQLTQIRYLCEQTPGPVSQMVKAAVPLYGKSRAEIEGALEESFLRETPSFERYVPLLGTLAHIAPLLGLLGTVTGLVRCFQVIQIKSSSLHPVNASDLAGGIWEALLTTVFGLLVAIPAYAMYNYLAYRINRLVSHLELSATTIARLFSRTETAASLRQPHPVPHEV